MVRVFALPQSLCHFPLWPGGVAPATHDKVDVPGKFDSADSWTRSPEVLYPTVTCPRHTLQVVVPCISWCQVYYSREWVGGPPSLCLGAVLALSRFSGCLLRRRAKEKRGIPLLPLFIAWLCCGVSTSAPREGTSTDKNCQ